MRSRLPRICWICEVSGRALRRQSREQRKKSLPLAANPVRVRDGAVEIRLLLGDGVFGALDLVGARGIGGAAVDCGKLGLQAHANGN